MAASPVWPVRKRLPLPRYGIRISRSLIADLLGGSDPSVSGRPPIVARAAGQSVLRQRDRAGSHRAGRVARSARCLRIAGRARGRQRPADAAGGHRCAHRSAPARGQTHAQRGRGRRCAFPAPICSATLGIDPVIEDLVAAELIDQVKFNPSSELCLPPSTDPHGGLRGTAQSRSRRVSPPPGRSYRSP